MKLNVLIVFILFQMMASSQKDSVIIKGRVTSTELKTVNNAFLHLALSDGNRYEYKTDSSGTYRFHFYPESIFSCTLSIASDKHTTSGHSKNLGFLASKEHAVFELKPGNTYEKDFVLMPVPYCGPYFPGILFYTNTLTSFNDSISKRDSIRYTDFDGSIAMLSQDLKENPGLVIEIQSHASVIETHPEQLSLKRAEYIRQLLIEKGINPKRMLIKGYGVRKLLVSDAVIHKANSKEEKLALHSKNQRVVFRVVNWDFKD